MRGASGDKRADGGEGREGLPPEATTFSEHRVNFT